MVFTETVDRLLSPTGVANTFGISVTTVGQWREKGWLRMETEDPPMCTLASASEAALTARLSPRQPPMPLDRPLGSNGPLAIHAATVTQVYYPPVSQAHCRGYRSVIEALLVIADASDPVT